MPCYLRLLHKMLLNSKTIARHVYIENVALSSCIKKCKLEELFTLVFNVRYLYLVFSVQYLYLL